MNASLRSKLALLLVFLPFVSAYPLWAATIYVDASATGANDGSSWADAYKYLQNALWTAGSGTEIRVAQGTYRPDEDNAHPDGNDSRYMTFQLKNGVALYGGFPSGGGSRDPNIYVTYLSADIGVPDNNSDNSYQVITASVTNPTAILEGFTITAGNANSSSTDRARGAGIYILAGSPTIINCIFEDNWANYGGGLYNSSGSPTVINCTFRGNSSAIYGGGMFNYGNSNIINCTFSSNDAHNGGGMFNYFYCSPTLTNCTFSGNSATYCGGGMYNHEFSSPTLNYCTFSGNSAYHGSGIYNYNSSSTVTNCTFNCNTSTNDGAGMYNYLGSPTIINCIFSGNEVCFSQGTSDGGGMFNNYSSPTLTNCKFITNSVDRAGGGMFNNYSYTTITNCIFIGNSATNYGGGMFNNDSNTTITNCTFSGNLATDFGGGMYDYNSSNPVVTSCTFSNNSATYGGGMFNNDSNTTITNCTFSGNLATDFGGGMYNYNISDPVVTNCILWGNTAPTGPQIYNSSSCSATVSFSDIQGGWAGNGNINADPLFIDPNGLDNIPGTEDDNLRLSPASSCIDTANNVAVPIGIETDPDGRDRFVDGDCNATVIVDMGAFEFTFAYFGDFDSDCDVDFLDYAIQAQLWLTDELLADIAPTPAGDGLVDTSDLAVLYDNWLESF
jgi:parallel beta-helix repeat protein